MRWMVVTRWATAGTPEMDIGSTDPAENDESRDSEGRAGKENDLV